MKKIFLLSLIGRGGTYHTTIQLSSNLAEKCETHLLIPSYSDTSQISNKVKLLKINAPPNTLKTILLSLNIFQHIKVIRNINKIRPEVINILDIHPWYVVYWPFLKARKVVTINDPQLHSGETELLNGIILKFVTRFMLKKADTIITLGKKQAEIVRQMGYKQKIITSKIGHYGFLSKKTQIKTETKTILFFGRIKEYKGLKYLLDAIIGIDCKLIIAGDGDLTQYQKQLDKLGTKVEIYNEFIADDAVSPYFERCTFTILPYTDATQTGIIPIAYSFKKPVIVTNVGSLAEDVMAGETGLIVRSRNVNELKIAIKKLLENPIATKKMGVKGYNYMKKQLDWDRITEKLLKELK